MPAPAAIIERQPYKNAPSRESLSSGDADARRRMIAGVATSAKGVTDPASTTKRVLMGGDQVLAPILSTGGGGGNSGMGGAPAAPAQGMGGNIPAYVAASALPKPRAGGPPAWKFGR